MPFRLSNYRELLDEPASPIRHDLRHADLICEPIYQLMRLQLLAWQLERHDPNFDVARVVLCASRRNDGLMDAIPDRLARSASGWIAGGDLIDVWTALLRRPDRFAFLDTAVFVSADSPTSDDYSQRYGHLRGC